MTASFKGLLDVLRTKALAFFRKHYVPKWIVFTMDNMAVFLTFYLAYILRFNFVTEDFILVHAALQGCFVVAIYAAFSLTFRSYTGLIRHTTVIDIFFVLIANTFSMLALLVMTLVGRKTGWPVIYEIPMSIILIHYVIVTLLMCFTRIIIKILYQVITSSFIEKKKVLIYGAGDMGVIAKRVIQSDVKSEYHIAGFIDRNKTLHGTKINSIPVYNPHVLSPDFIEKHHINAMIFAIRDIAPLEKSEIFRSALNIGLEVLEIPKVDTWFNGQFNASQIKKVKLEDLLGREPIQLNIKRIGLGLTGKTVLVTGAAGSIGSEIVRQLTRFKIKLLVLADQAETPIFHLENELKTLYSQCKVKIILADTTNAEKMAGIFKEFHPEVVFHAAAYKHVPLMEENPHEAIRVNVGGTKLITKLSVEYEVKKFVMVSTDKAVNPTNVMGASKRICEMIVQLKSQKLGNKTQFIITRFGNVLGSNGSVIPIFEKQISEGGPVTVTHPDIMRYFMTIQEACQLVLEAGFMGKGGEIFVFDMGKPVKIADLANQMIRLSGFTPDKEIKIEYTGLRPGEKLYEELLNDEETTKPTHHPKIKIANVKKLEAPGMLLQIENILQDLYELSKKEVFEICNELVPEFHSSNDIYNGNQDKSKLPEHDNEIDKLIDPFEALKRMINPKDNQ